MKNTVQNCAPKNLLEMKFKIPGGMEKCLSELSAKEMYHIFMFSSELQLKSIQYWMSKYPEENINFDKWFKVIHMGKLCQRKSLDFNWRIFHGHINTEIRLEKMRLSDGICKLCNIEKENVDHLLVQCKKSASVWHKIQQLVNTIGESDAISHFHKVVGYIHDGELFDVMNMMFSLCRWTIWKRRCLNRYEGVYINIGQLERWILNEIKEHCCILLKCKQFKDHHVLLDKLILSLDNLI